MDTIKKIDSKIESLEREKARVLRRVAAERVRDRYVTLKAVLDLAAEVEKRERKIFEDIAVSESYGGPDPDPGGTQGRRMQCSELNWVAKKISDLCKRAKHKGA